MKNDFFLDLHNKAIEDGKLSSNGLCLTVFDKAIGDPESFYIRQVFKLFSPTEDDFLNIMKEGKNVIYWASEEDNVVNTDGDIIITNRMRHDYNGLRETIVLLCHEVLNSEE